jgi:hypothetical protein
VSWSSDDFADCPKQTSEWRAWTEARAKALTANPSRDAVKATLALLARCGESLSTDAKARSCVSNLGRFAQALTWDELEGHSLGFSVTDDEYFKPPYPEMVRLPPELMEPAFSDDLDSAEPTRIEAAVHAIDDINARISDPSLRWQAFPYLSQHVPTPDGTHGLGRFLVYIPGKDYDRYVQFGMREDSSHPVPKNVSVVSVQKTDPATGKRLPVLSSRFVDIFRVRQPDGRIAFTPRYRVATREQNCYSCHKDAVLPIVPRAGTFREDLYGPTLRAVNDVMHRYGRVAPFGLSAADFGPALGPEQSEFRTDAFLRSCSSGVVTTPRRLARIRWLMRCTSCHDGETQGLLNYPSAAFPQPVPRRSLAEAFVASYGEMPPKGKDLTPPERAALFECLRREYYVGDGKKPGLLEQWLAGGACWKN